MLQRLSTSVSAVRGYPPAHAESADLNVPDLHNPIPSKMADSDVFLDQTTEVASIFLDLYLPPKPPPPPPGLRSPAQPGKGNKENQGVVVSDSDHDFSTQAGVGLAAPPAQLPSSFPRKDVDPLETARIIAERLKKIGDSMNADVTPDLQQLIKEQLGDKSVYQVTLPAFKMMCRTLLNRCSGYFTSGWQQVTAVYMSMGHLVAEIRTAEKQADAEQEEAAAATVSPRESQMKDFVGQALKEFNLDRWIEDQGGWERISVPEQGQTPNIVPIEGTSVDK